MKRVEATPVALQSGTFQPAAEATKLKQSIAWDLLLESVSARQAHNEAAQSGAISPLSSPLKGISQTTVRSQLGGAPPASRGPV